METAQQPELVERLLAALFAKDAAGEPLFSREVLQDAVPLTLLAFGDVVPRESISASLGELLEKFYARAGVSDPQNAPAVRAAIRNYLEKNPLPAQLLERITGALLTHEGDEEERLATEKRFAQFLGESTHLPEERAKNANSPLLMRIKELDGRKKR